MLCNQNDVKSNKLYDVAVTNFVTALTARSLGIYCHSVAFTLNFIDGHKGASIWFLSQNGVSHIPTFVS
jgi:MFS-type transporter involved in bile tolerance (Atg22 family)